MIVFVHGLWLTGMESAWLRRKLAADLGCAADYFRYRSVTADAGAVVDSLHDFIVSLRTDTLHLVGHSLGGILILRLLEKYAGLPRGRVVLLGSPVNGSSVAQRLVRWPIGPAALGKMAEELLCAPQAPWGGARELGIIAGSKSFGLGRIVRDLPYPNDGTVAVCETQLPGATDHLVLPVSHTAMEFSAEVVRQTGHFLKYGCFRIEGSR